MVTLAPRKEDSADLATGVSRARASTGAALPEEPAFSKAVGRTSRNCRAWR